MKNLLLLVISCLLINISCNNESQQEDSAFPLACVYQIKDTSYFNKVRVFLKKDKQQIAGHSGPSPIKYSCIPVQLDSLYFYESNYRNTCGYAIFGEKTLPLNVKYDTTNFYFNTDTMMSYIIDKDPFISYYQGDYYFIRGCKSLQEDTAQLNAWIRNGELGLHLKRLK